MVLGWIRRLLARTRTANGITIAQLRHYKLRFGLAVIGVALTVLAITLLAGAGMGVLDTGEQQFDSADRDLWVTGGETRLTPAGGGGFENSIQGSRSLAEEMAAYDDVDNAIPLAFETVYVRPPGDEDFQTFIGTGVSGGGSSVQVSSGEDLSGDTHYAGGTYDGEMTHEVLIDEETADRLGVGVGDTLEIGGSLAAARDNEFTVVGISSTYGQMLGAPTVTLLISELHQITGTTRTEPATFITITLEDGADQDAIQQELQNDFPEYNVQSSEEQLESVLQEQVLVLAAAAVLVVLSAGAGIALTLNLLSLVVYQQRRELAAFKAQGISTTLIVAVVVGQGLAIGLLGAGLGLLLTAPVARGLNWLGGVVVGFDGLVQTDPRIYVGGLVIAVLVGMIAAAVAGIRVGRTPPLEYL